MNYNQDGPTHHGCFDLSYMRLIPGMTVMAPKDENELRSMLATALVHEAGPVALRYPRGAGLGVDISGPIATLPIGKAEVLRKGKTVCLLAVGSMVAPAAAAAEELAVAGISATVVNMRFIKPLDLELLADVFATHSLIATIEENSVAGGMGGAVLEWAAVSVHETGPRMLTLGLPDRFLDHDSRDELLSAIGLEAGAIAASIRKELATLAASTAPDEPHPGQARQAAGS